MEIKDRAAVIGMITGIIGTITGVASLSIGGTVNYFNVVRQVDDIRVAPGSPPSLNVHSKNALIIYGSLTAAFINSGNRSAAITGVSGLLTNFDEPEGGDCDKGFARTTPLFFDIPAFVLKPGEILVKDFATERLGYFKKADGGGLLLSGLAAMNDVNTGLACLSLTITTPDSYAANVSRPVFKFTIPHEMVLFGVRGERMFRTDQPISYLQRTSGIFGG